MKQILAALAVALLLSVGCSDHGTIPEGEVMVTPPQYEDMK